MVSMLVELPDEQKDWIEKEAARRGFDGAAGFVVDLIHREKERKEKIAAMQVLIDEALADGISEKSIDEILDDARREAGLVGAARGIQA